MNGFLITEANEQAKSAQEIALPAQEEPALPVKQIGGNAMAASGGRYRLAWLKTLLNDCQLLLGCPPPAANITCQQFNVDTR